MKRNIKRLFIVKFAIALILALAFTLTACIGGANTGGMRVIMGVPNYTNPLSQAGLGVHIPVSADTIALPTNAELVDFNNGFIVYEAVRDTGTYMGVVDMREGTNYRRVLFAGRDFNQRAQDGAVVEMFGDYNFSRLIFSLILPNAARAILNSNGEILEPFAFYSNYFTEFDEIYILNDVNIQVGDSIWQIRGNEAVRVITNAPLDLVSVGNRLWSENERKLFERDGTLVYVGRTTLDNHNLLSPGAFADRFTILSDVRGAYITFRQLPHTSRNYSFIDESGQKWSQIVEVINFSNNTFSSVNFRYDLRFADFIPIALNSRGNQAMDERVRLFDIENSAHNWTVIFGAREVRNGLSMYREVMAAVNDRFARQQSFSEEIEVLRRNRFLVRDFNRTNNNVRLEDGMARTLNTFRQAERAGDNVIWTTYGYYNFDGVRILTHADFVSLNYIGRNFLAVRRSNNDLYNVYYLINARGTVERRLMDTRLPGYYLSADFGVYVITTPANTLVYNYNGEQLLTLTLGQTFTNHWLYSFTLHRNSVRDFARYGIMATDTGNGNVYSVIRFR